eukprot:scaffold8451_cov30-Tisochrysis_lutea.AAC.2
MPVSESNCDLRNAKRNRSAEASRKDRMPERKSHWTPTYSYSSCVLSSSVSEGADISILVEASVSLAMAEVAKTTTESSAVNARERVLNSRCSDESSRDSHIGEERDCRLPIVLESDRVNGGGQESGWRAGSWYSHRWPRHVVRGRARVGREEEEAQPVWRRPRRHSVGDERVGRGEGKEGEKKGKERGYI